ncbi:MAG TPA: hypothetical protein DCG72_04795 [Gammaproteobacteria bacterium]|nr:hypothetical protein [Gammaproteobacteria bacterium]
MMRILTIMILLIVVGCSSRPAIERHSDFAPVRPLQPEQTESSTGSIFTNRSSMSLFEGQREWYIGDIVTIVLSETAQASRNTNLSTERSSSNDVLGTKGPNDLFPTTGFIGKALPKLKRDGAQISSEGGGSTNQAASLQGIITATVVEVLSNGNLILQGEKQLSMTEGSEFIQVRGIVRSTDIQMDNSVSSQRLANAQISYKGTGDLAASTKPGWLSSALFKFWPL